MGVAHLGDVALKQEIAKLWRAIRAISKATLQNSSIGRGLLRFYSGGRIRIEDGGGIDILSSGYLNIDGDLTGDGRLDWTGVVYLRGPTGVQGNFATSGNTVIGGTLKVEGVTTLDADVTLNEDLTLGASGQITAGTVRINRFGSYGGQILSTGTVLYLGAGQTVIVGAEYLSTNKIAATDIEGFTLDILGAKSFRIPHPLKPGYWLRHGSTESPVSGIEYWGEGVLDDTGHSVIELPDYFDELAKLDGRTPFATGRGFAADWTDIDDGKFTVTGKPGGRFSWLVKAERIGGDFLLEEEIPAAPSDGTE